MGPGYTPRVKSSLHKSALMASVWAYDRTCFANFINMVLYFTKAAHKWWYIEASGHRFMMCKCPKSCLRQRAVGLPCQRWGRTKICPRAHEYLKAACISPQNFRVNKKLLCDYFFKDKE
ncbi:UNVERIFIED_CONTAM: hypothetical protein K2H54_077269 [Gekko kuhli]